VKKPAKPARGRKRRFVDPLGDPLQMADLDGVRDYTPPPRKAAAPSGEPAVPDDPFPPGLDLDGGIGADDLEPPKGIVSRLFGGGDDFDPRGQGFDLDGDYDSDGGGRGGRGRTIMMAGLGTLLLAGGGAAGWWLLSGDDTGGEPVAGLETPASDEAVGPGGGAVPVLQTPERVVLAVPPLTVPQPDGGAEGTGTSEVVADPTAATDRSADRRPWLAGGESGGAEDAGQPTHAAPGDMAHAEPGPEEPALGDTAHAEPGHEEPAPGDMAHAEAGPEEPAPGDMAHAEAGHEEPAPGDMAHADPGHEEPAPTNAQPHDGVRHRVDLTAPEIDLPNVPGLLPVPPGLAPLAEPEAPRRLGDAPPVPSYQTLAALDGPRPVPLPEAPFSALQDSGPHGPVPTVGPDGMVPWRSYAARDPAPPDSPRVAIVVHGLGMMTDSLQAAIAKLPPQVTLSFSPYARNLPDKMALAREGGHEVLLDLPMESEDFPARDPGPMGLLTLLPEADNGDRLDQTLAAGQGYVGVMASNGGRFAVSPEHMEPVLRRLRRAGVLYLHQGDDRSLVANRRLLPPVTGVDVVVDGRGFAASVQARLDYLRRLAQSRGTAVGIMRATPLNFAALRAWMPDLDASGVALAPLSSVVEHAGGAGEAAAADPADTGPAMPAGDHQDAAGHAGEGHG